MKKKMISILALVILGCIALSGCSKDEILDHYNNVIQSAGAIELTNNHSLTGTREKGKDVYTADYKNTSATEYIFGGRSIDREAGKDITVTCTLAVTDGTAKVFWISGSDEPVTLIETKGAFQQAVSN